MERLMGCHGLLEGMIDGLGKGFFDDAGKDLWDGGWWMEDDGWEMGDGRYGVNPGFNAV